jgi:hypothetical protein
MRAKKIKRRVKMIQVLDGTEVNADLLRHSELTFSYKNVVNKTNIYKYVDYLIS